MLSRFAPDASAQSFDARAYLIIVPADSGKEYVEADTLQLKAFIRRLAMIDDTTTTPGGLSLAALIDTLNELMTGTSGRLLHYSNLQPGTDGDLLVTAAGAATWTATPTIADRASQFCYWSSINHTNAADTTGDKHVAYVGALSREWPVPHGTVWSAVSANFYLRDGDKYEGYSATMTAVGSGAGAIAAGDKLVLRFFPGGNTSISKYVKLYRIPAGYHWIGTGVANKVYGEYIGHWIIDGAKFSSTSTATNLEVNLTLKVK
jgi:hypothetical protein